MAEPPVTFAGLLRRLRDGAGLTQEELAEAAQLSVRSVSDLERGVNQTARKETARLLADALRLTGSVREEFEAIARGRPVPVAARTSEPSDSARSARTLPRDIGSFTGREHELSALVAAATNSGGVVGIHVIGGMAGVGKTAFAVHAAHLLAGHFPDGQLFLPLHGHTPGRTPAEPGDALASLLFMMGIPAGQIPPDTEVRAALWRSRLAGKRLLLVLDDAVSSDQVRSLLPGDSGCLVLVTSRRHLSALGDTQAISLNTFSPGEANRLLVRLAGRPGLSPEDPAAEEITELCGYLPLAIGLMARQVHHHPAWPLAEVAAELTASQDRLDLMTAENLSVAAAFDLSYADLGPAQQRLFRRLGLHPGTDIDAYAAAALDGNSLSTARRALEALYDHYLLTEPAYGRYRMHDLIRERARVLAAASDPDDDRERATARLLDYYQHTAAIADALFVYRRRPASESPAGTAPAAVPAIADRDQAASWIRAERTSLLACLDHVTTLGQHVRVVKLSAALTAMLRQEGPLSEALARHSAAVRSARHLGDRTSEARSLVEIGHLRLMTSDFQGAAQVLMEALEIYRETGDRRGQASALTRLGNAWECVGDYTRATRAVREALSVYRDIGDQRGEANTLTLLGNSQRLTGAYSGAVKDLARALAIYRELGDRLGQANSLSYLGEVRGKSGDHPGALEALGEALRIHRDMGTKLGQANTLVYLGDRLRMAGDYPGAVGALGEALGIFRDIGSRVGQANALSGLGSVRLLIGDYAQAARDLEDALFIYREAGDRGGEAEALNEAGTLSRIQGNLEEAWSYHLNAFHISREIGSSRDEAYALAGLGRCEVASGNGTAAEEQLRQALEIFQRIGAAEAAGIAAELEGLTAASDVSAENAGELG